MNDVFIGFLSVFWLGMLTTIHPCPLATNIAALSYLCAASNLHKKVIVLNIVFVLGRIVSFSLLGIIITQSIFSIKGLVEFLRLSINRIFGILLILSGMILAGLLFNKRRAIFSQWIERFMQNKQGGLAFSFILSILISLLFCPATAAIFFGVLIPLSINSKLGFLFPIIYSIGTTIPIIILEITIVKSLPILIHNRNKHYNVEILITRVAGWLLIAVGIYYTLENVFHIF